MKRLYIRRADEGDCRITLRRLDEEEWEIQTVMTAVPCRNRGMATSLMREVMADADAESYVLLLTSGIGRDSGLSTEQLVDWYERLGFDAIARGSYPGTTLMQRVPRVLV